MSTINWKGSSFMALDPGIKVTGYSFYYVDNSGTLRLKDYGCWKPLEDGDEYLRVAWIADQAMAYVRSAGPGFTFLERPPDTVYNQGKGSKFKSADYVAIARAQSVFKTMGVFYALHTILRTQTKTMIQPIYPVQWELSKKQRGNQEVKEWSREMANKITKEARPQDGVLNEQNTADAITMGYFGYHRGYAY